MVEEKALFFVKAVLFCVRDCSTCEAVPKLLRRDEPRLDGEVRKACFLRKQKCAQNKNSKIARIETVTKAKSVDKVIEELKAREIKSARLTLPITMYGQSAILTADFTMYMIIPAAAKRQRMSIMSRGIRLCL